MAQNESEATQYPRGERETDGERQWPAQVPPTGVAFNNREQATGSLILQLMDEKLTPLREAISLIEAQRAQDEASIRAALLDSSDQISHVRVDIGRLHAESLHQAANLQRIDSDHFQTVNGLLNRISLVRGELGQQQRRMRNLTIALIFGAVVAGAAIVALGTLFLLR